MVGVMLVSIVKRYILRAFAKDTILSIDLLFNHTGRNQGDPLLSVNLDDIHWLVRVLFWDYYGY